jgi:hypothetical protein
MITDGTITAEKYTVQTNEPTEYTIRKLPDGGFVVADYQPGMHYQTPPYRFASEGVEASLKYIKSKFEPKPATRGRPH